MEMEGFDWSIEEEHDRGLGTRPLGGHCNCSSVYCTYGVNGCVFSLVMEDHMSRLT